MSNRVYTLEEIAAIIAPILITVKSLKYNDDNDFKENLEKERVLIYEAA